LSILKYVGDIVGHPSWH